jgi:hypothetical protein
MKGCRHCITAIAICDKGERPGHRRPPVSDHAIILEVVTGLIPPEFWSVATKFVVGPVQYS